MSIRVTLHRLEAKRGGRRLPREGRGACWDWSGELGKALGGLPPPRGTPGRGHFQRKVPVPVQEVVELPGNAVGGFLRAGRELDWRRPRCVFPSLGERLRCLPKAATECGRSWRKPGRALADRPAGAASSGLATRPRSPGPAAHVGGQVQTRPGGPGLWLSFISL